VAQSRELAHIPKIMTLDHQYYGTLKQRLAPWILGRYLKRFAKVGVTGERAAVYAKHLGFQDNQIEPKVIGINIKGFVNARNANGNHYPNRFLFVGRYVASKGLDVLLDAYKTYRRQVENPWPLTCCGAGPQKGLRENMEGVEDLGFKLPEKLPKIFAEHGVFVMPSLHEPWGIVIAEAAASGMPVIATSACGAVDEFVRDGVNGIIVRPGSAEELSNAFIKMHEQKEKFINSGETLSRQLTESYDFEHWAVRWRDLALELKQARKAG